MSEDDEMSKVGETTRGVLQHPVPPGLLVHIGDVTVSFALLEANTRWLVNSLLREHQRVVRVITAELSIKNLRALVISLYVEEHGEDTDFEVLKQLLKRATDLEASRNQIVHSLWATGPSPDSVTRIKWTAKERRGMQFVDEIWTEEQLADLAFQIRKLATNIQNFQLGLIREGKFFNNPLAKK